MHGSDQTRFPVNGPEFDTNLGSVRTSSGWIRARVAGATDELPRRACTGCSNLPPHLALGGCGSRSNLLSPEGDAGPGSGAPEGFVQCGDQVCDIASGNMCYRCDKLSAPICHTMDLPTSCANPAFVLCDGDNDCEAGESCIEDCEISGPCAVPSHVCRAD
jgi:hypothetical protein